MSKNLTYSQSLYRALFGEEENEKKKKKNQMNHWLEPHKNFETMLQLWLEKNKFKILNQVENLVIRQENSQIESIILMQKVWKIF